MIGVVLLVAAMTPMVACEPKAKPGSALAQPYDLDTYAGRHQAYVHRMNLAQRSPTARVVFIGDSIVAGFSVQGAPAFEAHLAPLGAIDLGVGGERTGTLLWRIENGAVDGMNLERVLVLVGTNDLKTQPSSAIVEGIVEIARALRERTHAAITVLGILPRTDVDRAAQIAETNRMLAARAAAESFTFIDMSAIFRAPEALMDGLHPSAQAYDAWSRALAEHVRPTP